jgi:hypothetical protein
MDDAVWDVTGHVSLFLSERYRSYIYTSLNLRSTLKISDLLGLPFIGFPFEEYHWEANT